MNRIRFGFSVIFYSEKPILKVIILITGIIRPTFIMLKLTSLGKVPQNKPLGLISYSTVWHLICIMGRTNI